MIIIGLGIAIAGIYLLSNPVPEKIPSINVNFSYNGTHLIIRHNGGDTLQKDEMYLMVDGIPKHAYSISDGGTSWSVGKDIELALYSTSLERPNYLWRIKWKKGARLGRFDRVWDAFKWIHT